MNGIKCKTIEVTFDFLLFLSTFFIDFRLLPFSLPVPFLFDFVGILLLGTNAKSREICSLITSYIFVSTSNKVFKTMYTFEVKVYNSFSTALIRAIEPKMNWHCLRSQFRVQLNINNNNNNVLEYHKNSTNKNREKSKNESSHPSQLSIPLRLPAPITFITLK